MTPNPEAQDYTAALVHDETGALVVEGRTDGERFPLWTIAAEVSPDGQKVLLGVIDRCWHEIGGHVGQGTVCELVTTLELVCHELLFDLVIPEATREAVEAGL